MPSYLVPNSPRKRIEYVARALPRVAIETSQVVSHLVGADIDTILFVLGRTVGRRPNEEDWLDIANCFSADRHPYEAMIPWVAIQLNAMRKDVDKDLMSEEAFEDAYHALAAKLPQIAAWVAHARPDLTRLTIGEALRQMSDFEPETGAVPQGEVIYRFADGWTVQELTRCDQIFAEGETVQHCMRQSQRGEMYFNTVLDGEARIFSLRTPTGKPCVSMEFRVDSDNAHGGQFRQIYAKQNTGLNASVPRIVKDGASREAAEALWSSIQKYKPRVKEFIHQAFTGEPCGLLMSGVPASSVDLAYQTLAGLDMTEMDLSGARLQGTDMSDARMYGVRSGGIMGIPSLLPQGFSLVNGYLIGPYADLRGADVHGMDLSNTTMHGVRSGGVTGTPRLLPAMVKLLNGYFVGRSADLADADLSFVDLGNACLAQAVMYNANLEGAEMGGVRLIYGVTSGGIKGTPHTLPAGWQLLNGYLIGSGANLRGADLRGLDLGTVSLRRASLERARLEGTNLSRVQLDPIAGQGVGWESVDTSNGEQLTGATYDAKTRWPEGFAPPDDAVLVANPGRKSSRRKTSRGR